MNFSPPEVSDIIDRISALTHPCLFECAQAIQASSWPNNAVNAIIELRDRGVLTFLQNGSHPLLVSIMRCHVCSWEWPRTTESHQSWYVGHTQAYRHIYQPTGYYGGLPNGQLHQV